MVDVWKDNTVLVSESFDQETAAKLVNATRDASQKHASIYVPEEELGMHFYDLPAFRAFQERVGDDILIRSIPSFHAN